VLGPAGDAQFESPTAQTAAVMERTRVFMMVMMSLVDYPREPENLPSPPRNASETRLARKTFKKY
jgi:hypothetical protein